MLPLEVSVDPLLLDPRDWLSSVPAIVAVVIIATNRAKVWLATTPANWVPLWAIAMTASALMTAGAHTMGFLSGDPTKLALDAAVYAAAASGFREWWLAGIDKPLSASSTSAAILARKETR